MAALKGGAVSDERGTPAGHPSAPASREKALRFVLNATAHAGLRAEVNHTPSTINRPPETISQKTLNPEP